MRWGVIGTGRVSNDFVLSLKHVEEAEIVMCAARSAEKSKAFASTHEIARFGTKITHLYITRKFTRKAMLKYYENLISRFALEHR